MAKDIKNNLIYANGKKYLLNNEIKQRAEAIGKQSA